jgi:hypothetical protein
MQADYMLQLIDRYQTEAIHSFTPSQAASRGFTAYCRRVLLNTVWSDGCRSHFKAGTANQGSLSMWPGSSMHFGEALCEVHAEDYDWVWSGQTADEQAANRFAWLGNGFSATGADPTSDLAWYITEQDEGPLMSRGARRRQFTKSGTCPGRNEMLAPLGRVAD